MNQYKRPESVLVVVYTRAGRVLLLKRADLPDFWQSVTGAMRWDEHDPRVTAARELEEETGLRVAPEVLQDLACTRRFPILPAFRRRYAPAVQENVEHAFALELEDAPAIRLSEHTAYDWATFAEAESKMASWTNRDALRDVQRRLTARREAVVLVHGWLMNRGWMTMLAWRLRRAGFEVHLFSYATARLDLRGNAARLDAFLQTIAADTIHLVGHSLGGLVIRALLHYFPQRRAGRVVTLGSPHQGSLAAQRLARTRWGRAVLGKSVLDVVTGLPRAWPLPAREFGTISGNVPIGIGRAIAPLPVPCDGTLTLDETSLPGTHARQVLPVTHTGLLTSRRVAEAVTRFLRQGDFG